VDFRPSLPHFWSILGRFWAKIWSFSGLFGGIFRVFFDPRLSAKNPEKGRKNTQKCLKNGQNTLKMHQEQLDFGSFLTQFGSLFGHGFHPFL